MFEKNIRACSMKIIIKSHSFLISANGFHTIIIYLNSSIIVIFKELVSYGIRKIEAR